MYISPINSFKYNPVSFRGIAMCYNSQEVGRKTIEDEVVVLADIQKRKDISVDVPIIKLRSQNGNLFAQFVTKGDHADIKQNPIREEHFANLFKNFLSLDKIGIFHGNLSLEHLFFSEDGKVELDCFRTSSAFALQNGGFEFTGAKRDTALPFEMPSNAKNFEEHGLSQYLQTMSTREEKFDFMKKYLIAKSDYHAQRAELIYKNPEKPSEKMTLGLETFKKELFKDPSDNVVNFELYKAGSLVHDGLEMADKKWAEGCGKYTGTLKPEAKVDSMILMFECLDRADEIIKTADILAQENSENPLEKMYFELEKESAIVLRQKICDKFNGMKKI